MLAAADAAGQLQQQQQQQQQQWGGLCSQLGQRSWYGRIPRALTSSARGQYACRRELVLHSGTCLYTFSFFFLFIVSFSTNRSVHVLAPYFSCFQGLCNSILLFLNPFCMRMLSVCFSSLILFSPIFCPFIHFFHNHAFLNFLINVLF